MSNSTITSVCHRCGQRIVGIKHRHEGKEYCDTCYQALMQELQEIEQQKIVLYSYITDLFGINECPEYVIFGIDKAIKSGKKVKGIEGTLYWYYQIEGHSPNNIGEIVTIINTQYENAKKHIQETKRIKQENDSVDLHNIPTRTIKIASNRKIKKWKPDYRMEDL